ncbi:MAG: hypothetical protein QXN05_04790 [Acidilobaceae archaeon]
MPKRVSREVKSGKRENVNTALPSSQERSQIKKTRRASLEVNREVLDQVVEVATRELWETLSLTEICEPQVLTEAVKEIALEMTLSGRELSVEAIVKQLLRTRDQLFKYVATRLVERGVESLNDKQIEFIVMSAPEIAGRLAPQLYKEAKERGLVSVVEALKDLWQVYGRPLPVKCPRCGFYAVAPDYQCVVCGETVSEEEIKKLMNFENLLMTVAQRLPLKMLEEIVFAGYVVYDGEVKPPSMKALSGPATYIIPLSKREKNALAEVALSRRLSVSSERP